MKWKNKPKNKNIRNQLSISIIVVVTGAVLLIFILNSTLLGYIYMYSKQRAMVNAFNTLNAASSDGVLYTDDYYYTFEALTSKEALSTIVISADGTVCLASQNDYNMIKSQMYMILFGDGEDNPFIDYDGEDYSISRLTDNRNEQEYMILWGTLDDGNLIMMRTTIASMTESAKVTNRFLLFVGALGIVVSIFVARALSRFLTKPLKELTDISERMIKLDFNAKYIPRDPGNEIDKLGIHMNELSESLEEAIGELKQANTELQHDIEIRDKNEEMRKEFLSNVSHELKTPIAVIQGYAEGLAEGVIEDKESQQYYCEVIVDEAKRMNTMVKQLLNLNQIEYGRDNVNMEHFTLKNLISGVVAANEILATQSEVSIILEEFEDVSVWADEFFTEQVLTNYITNGIHYAKYDKQVRIKVVDQGKDVRICVFNTGDPIPEESIQRIWEKFYKVDKARTRTYGGSGIGLSVVKAVMDSFHKDCGVTNYKNGVEFWFELDK
ncbi:MAG: HAMP domain-containing histidine kinase [Lachnospiraceae bacterium]|nr:HAMP domain-containing histidine kinase [Lachnospiraceae bacterium]